MVNDHVKLLILCGATAGVIRQAVEQAENYQGLEIVEATEYRDAVALADGTAGAGGDGVVVPAHAAPLPDQLDPVLHAAEGPGEIPDSFVRHKALHRADGGHVIFHVVPSGQEDAG